MELTMGLGIQYLRLQTHGPSGSPPHRQATAWLGDEEGYAQGSGTAGPLRNQR